MENITKKYLDDLVQPIRDSGFKVDITNYAFEPIKDNEDYVKCYIGITANYINSIAASVFNTNGHYITGRSSEVSNIDGLLDLLKDIKHIQDNLNIDGISSILSIDGNFIVLKVFIDMQINTVSIDENLTKKELTEEYLKDTFQPIKDIGIDIAITDYKKITYNKKPINFKVIIDPDGDIDCYTIRTSSKMETQIQLFTELKHILENLEMDRVYYNFNSSDLTIEIDDKPIDGESKDELQDMFENIQSLILSEKYLEDLLLPIKDIMKSYNIYDISNDKKIIFTVSIESAPSIDTFDSIKHLQQTAELDGIKNYLDVGTKRSVHTDGWYTSGSQYNLVFHQDRINESAFSSIDTIKMGMEIKDNYFQALTDMGLKISVIPDLDKCKDDELHFRAWVSNRDKAIFKNDNNESILNLLNIDNYLDLFKELKHIMENLNFDGYKFGYDAYNNDMKIVKKMKIEERFQFETDTNETLNLELEKIEIDYYNSGDKFMNIIFKDGKLKIDEHSNWNGFKTNLKFSNNLVLEKNDDMIFIKPSNEETINLINKIKQSINNI